MKRGPIGPLNFCTALFQIKSKLERDLRHYRVV